MHEQRLDTHSIPGQHQSFFRFLPESNRKHSAKTTEAIRVPRCECVQDDLRIAVGSETESITDQPLAQFFVVVDFAIEGENRVSVEADHRLPPAGHVDDLETNGPD